MDWAQLGEEVIKLGAPLLGAALTGGASPVLQAALGAAFSLANPDTREASASDIWEGIQQAISVDPNAATRLQQIETDHAEHVAQCAAGSGPGTVRAGVTE